MEAFHLYLNDLVTQNKIKFAAFPDVKWLNPYRALQELEYREELINSHDNWLFKQTKPFHHQISQGCKYCGLGMWSCLFITGKCNANCFYCPASQNQDEPPGTQSFTFETPESYAEYINYFKFKGVSFSGGEPLLFFDRTLQYLKQVRKKCSPEIYTWMYTNGILAEPVKLRKLASAGLNEIRFDIGATGFKLDKVKIAKGIIPNLTIEIPAIPEEKEKIKQLLPEMIKAGVTNLNLHQLRLTLHNAPRLLKRNYTFISAEQPVVLESEIAALEILKHAKENHLNIGINYCSFAFKNRFQKAGFRKQMANVLAGQNEIITENGFLRDFTSDHVSYQTLLVHDRKPGENSCDEIKMTHKSYFVKRETALKKTVLSNNLINEAKRLTATEPTEIPTDPVLFKIWQKEYIEKGLREY